MKLKAMMRPAVGSLLLLAPMAMALVSPLTTTSSKCTPMKASSRLFGSASSSGSSSAVSSLPRLFDSKGTELSVDQASERLAGKRVAYYFSAGWCPMCTRFEPSLVEFRQAAQDSGKELELIYVPSDRSANDAAKRSASMDMLQVPFGEESEQLKKEYKIWAGSEALKLGFGRRSGVPALVVLDGETGEEMAFLPTESQGVQALGAWPLDEEKGVW
mmetsp:Transcript_29282/g.48399  ORF Transcript_29282/g.48399 Transcript_29282/m.48399 type:complete len:216 (-) Transcript_29282:51-698(-)|eukprot:CAMPEP_0119012940 /NCGR_PEP_ID=MMETSP1176-20130426/7709_1 /TAXON_ID=265551 /ORGANISM="Synedropsis recta cf, Strain CCMP1620" /LENGTH=215 /DNA_ID=CAMNT_0006965979 /DNA_START=52 /DNA_END=699 /DNA_ORIENTATION=-